MIRTSEAIDAISAALAKASPHIGSANKDSKNPHFKSDYASLESAINASKAALTDEGVFVMQSPGEISEGAIRMATRLVHSSGQWIETTCDVPLQKRDAQGVGSAITYGRRYSLMAALNIPAADDDGTEASKPPPKSSKTPKADVHPDERLDFEGVCERPAQVEQLNAAASREPFAALKSCVEFCAAPEDLEQWAQENAEAIFQLHPTARHYLREAYDKRMEDLILERSAA